MRDLTRLTSEDETEIVKKVNRELGVLRALTRLTRTVYTP
jgi:hypothetical protein